MPNVPIWPLSKTKRSTRRKEQNKRGGGQVKKKKMANDGERLSQKEKERETRAHASTPVSFASLQHETIVTWLCVRAAQRLLVNTMYPLTRIVCSQHQPTPRCPVAD